MDVVAFSLREARAGWEANALRDEIIHGAIARSLLTIQLKRRKSADDMLSLGLCHIQIALPALLQRQRLICFVQPDPADPDLQAAPARGCEMELQELSIPS